MTPDFSAIDQITLYGWPTLDGKIKLGTKDGYGQIIDRWPEQIVFGDVTFSVEWSSEDEIGYNDDYGCRSAIYFQDGRS